MRGYLVYALIVKYLSHRFCLILATANEIGRPYRGIFLGFFETFLEGSVDHVIHGDSIVNRRFFIYYSLATRSFKQPETQDSNDQCCLCSQSGRQAV